MQLPFFFVIVFRVIVQTDLVCLVCEGSCKCKKKTLLFRAGSSRNNHRHHVMLR
jgi:hypothetical protein